MSDERETERLWAELDAERDLAAMWAVRTTAAQASMLAICQALDVEPPASCYTEAWFREAGRAVADAARRLRHDRDEYLRRAETAEAGLARATATLAKIAEALDCDE